LPAGSYEVEAKLGLASAKQTVEVKDDEATPLRLDLNAGVLKMQARARKDAQPLPGSVFTVTSADSGAPLWMGREQRPEIVLPAGNYRVTAEAGAARQEQDVTITAATGTTVDAQLATGRLELSASRAGPSAQPDLMTDGVTYVLYEDDPDAPQGRREVARSAAAAPDFTLPAGTYYVLARTQTAEAREQIAIGAGDVVKRTLSLALAHLELSATLGGAAVPSDLPLTFRVVRLDPEPREVVRTTAREPVVDLSAGRYRIEAMAGATNVLAATDVALAAGQNQKLALKIDAGNVTLRRGPGADVFWEIRDAKQRTVARSSQSEPTLLLAPGRYIVNSETAERPLSSVIEVKAGEHRTFDFSGVQ
jgi:Ca-activated chloride channel family protein